MKKLIGAIIIAITVIAGEGVLIIIAYEFGFWPGSLLTTLVSLLIIWLVDYTRFGEWDKIQHWFQKQEKDMPKIVKTAISVGKFVGISTGALIVGPVINSLLVKNLFKQNWKRFCLNIYGSILFSSFWIGIYSGLIKIAILGFGRR